jgi:hypothetical protein
MHYFMLLVLAWNPPTTRDNGSLLLPEEISMYTVYKDGVVLEYTSGVEATIGKVKGKCHTYTVTATDTDGLESKHSASVVVCKKRPRK